METEECREADKDPLQKRIQKVCHFGLDVSSLSTVNVKFRRRRDVLPHACHADRKRYGETPRETVRNQSEG